MAQPTILNSFTAGELSPTLFGRVDLTQYKSGLALCRNFFVDYRGGVSNRTGTQFISRAWLDVSRVRLIPFEYSVTAPQKTYILVFGDKYMNVIKNSGLILDSGSGITNITSSSPGVVTTSGANSWHVGDVVFITGVTGMTKINGLYCQIIGITVVTGGLAIALGTFDDRPLDTTQFGAFIGGGVIQRVLRIPTPYAAADLALLKYSQLTSVMTLTHPSYPPTDLTYGGDLSWTFNTTVFGPTLVAPNTPTVTSSGAGTTWFYYVVTAVDANGGESSPSPFGSVQGINIASAAGTNQISWAAVSGAVSYNIYKIGPSQINPLPAGAIPGFIGSATGTGFLDTNLPPAFDLTPPIIQNPFANGNNPAVSCNYQQRRTYAASTINPQNFWMSQPGLPTNFNISNPTTGSDAITGTLVSKQVNTIKSMLPMPGGLIVLTAYGAWQVSGGGATTPITPADAQGTPQAYNGASDVPPLVINENILYCQAKGGTVRDLSYNIYANIYTGIDISLMSNHLFFSNVIVEWTWAEEPFKTVWAVRDDGTLLTLSYIKAQQLAGWAHSDTLGFFESVTSVVEGNSDVVYVVVRRIINGQIVRYIERFHERKFKYDAEDSWFVDAALENAATFPVAYIAATAATGTVGLYPTIGIGWQVGDVVRMGGGVIQITATSIGSITATGEVIQPITDLVPNDPNGAPAIVGPGDWSYTTPFSTVQGLSHLEAMTVTGVADGSVIPPTEVVNGQITLPNPASKVIIGLAYTAQLKTLPIDLGEPTVQGKRKKLSGLTMRVYQTRGLKYGRTLDTLRPVKERKPSTILGAPIPLQSTDEYVILDPLWDPLGQFYVVQDQPLPATVIALMPEVTVGDTPK